jgi:hypothetical protein
VIVLPERTVVPALITLLQGHPDPELIMMIPVFKIGILAVVSGIVALPLVRAIAKRLDRPSPPRVTTDGEARLARIEQAVDAIAIEVERISEAQRFTTKLLSERAPAPLPPTAERPR